MRKILLCLTLALATLFARAADSAYVQAGTLVGVKGNNTPGDVEAGLGWALPWTWDGGKLGARVDTGLGYVRSRGYESLRISVMPTLRYQGSARIFAELGAGAAYFSGTELANGHDLGRHVLFGVSLAGGYVFGNNELGLRLTHFSNAGLAHPNPGENIVALRFTHRY